MKRTCLFLLAALLCLIACKPAAQHSGELPNEAPTATAEPGATVAA